MLDDAARARLLFGTDEPVEPPRRLTAGALSADLTAGNLRSIRWHGTEVLRGIAFVIRDTRWGTYAPAIDGLDVVVDAERFTVAYGAEVEGHEGAFAYRVAIAGGADGRLRFSARGSATREFATNRTGFVVLHGLEGVVGRPLAVRHADGTVTRTRFPILVQPSQPAGAIAGLRHDPMPGLSVEVGFSGDVFEMEDQRNWTDASFKTYVRPLSRGYPYRIQPGEPLSQAVDLHVSGTARGSKAAVEPRIAVEWGAPGRGVLPRVGLYVDGENLSGAEARRDAVAALRPGYLQARVDLADASAIGVLDRVLRLARSWRCPLHLDAVIPGIRPRDELAELAGWVGHGRPDLEALFVLPARDLRSRPAGVTPPSEAAPVDILAAVRAACPGVPLVGGMPVGFPELNRNPPPPGIDMVAHATQAIVHAADDLSVMETLEALPHVIATTLSLAGALPYRIGPATIGVPASASASPPAGNPFNRRLPTGSPDPRQRGLFAASFLIGLVAATRDVTHLTLGAPTGDIGLLDDEGRPLPAALAFAETAVLSGLPRLSSRCTAAGSVAAVAALTDRGPVLWLANLTGAPVTVALRGPRCRRLRVIDVDRLAQGIRGPVVAEPMTAATVHLGGHAICRIEAEADAGTNR